MVNSFFSESVTDYSGKPLPGKNLPLGRFHGEAISKLNPAWRPSLLPSPWDFPHLPPARVYTCFVGYSRGAHGQPPAAWGPCPKAPSLLALFTLAPATHPPPHQKFPSGPATLARQRHRVRALPSVLLPPHPAAFLGFPVRCLTAFPVLTEVCDMQSQTNPTTDQHLHTVNPRCQH